MKLAAEDELSEGDAALDDGTMPEDGAIAEEGFKTKLAEVFVKNPVDGAVPEIWVPLFRP